MQQKKFLVHIFSYSTDDIIHLDYSSKAGVIPTLRQMIMGLKSQVSQQPLFHCVDLDWRSEGFTFQFSSSLKEESETAIHTLLPLLSNKFPMVDVESNFDENAVLRCQHMYWDANKLMIVDLLAPEDSEEIGKDEDLGGFVFDMDTVRNDVKQPQQG